MQQTLRDYVHCSEPICFNAEYLSRLSRNDHEIESHFYAYFIPRLQMKLRNRPLQESERESIIQETLLRVRKAVETGEIRTAQSFGAYVSAVCDSVLSDSLCPSHAQVSGVDLPDPSLEAVAPRWEGRRLAKEILDDLSPSDRNLLRAKIFNQVSLREAGARLGASALDRLCDLLRRAPRNLATGCDGDSLRPLDFA